MERGASMCLCPPRYSGQTCESGDRVLACVFLLWELLMGIMGCLTCAFRGDGVSL